MQTNFNTLFYVTVSVVVRIDIFSRKEYIDIVMRDLQFCQKNKGLNIYGYVIMTNPFHLIALQQQNQLNKILGHFKSFSSKEILKVIEEDVNEKRQEWLLYMFRYHAKYKAGFDEYHLWDGDNNSVCLHSRESALEKLKWMHENPVRAGFVEKPEHWLLSSAKPNSPIQVSPI